ncbi:hypothetical protein ACVIYL_001257 [Bradyrhizobium sp. USDA 3315]
MTLDDATYSMSSRRKPGPIATEGHCCTTLGPQLSNDSTLWLWVPAFAGTTRGEIALHPRHPEEAAKRPSRRGDGHQPGRASFETRYALLQRQRRSLCAGMTGSEMFPAYTFTMRLPRFSPASRPISACGVFSIPLMTSSCTLSLPEATQDCRSASAASRWSM